MPLETDPIPTILSVDALTPRRRTPPARRLTEAVAEHIRRTGLYPPLIVRPRGRRGRFEVIDGHARLVALKHLGADEARCEIWPVDDAAADLLETSLNVLRGRRDGGRQRPLLKRTVRRLGLSKSAALLGMTARGLAERLAADGPLPPIARPETVLPLHPVTFHLTGQKHQRLEEALRAAARQDPRLPTKANPRLPAGATDGLSAGAVNSPPRKRGVDARAEADMAAGHRRGHVTRRDLPAGQAGPGPGTDASAPDRSGAGAGRRADALMTLVKEAAR